MAHIKGLCNWLYNMPLEQRRAEWKMRRTSLSYPDQANDLSELKALVPEFKDVHSQVLQHVLRRLDHANQAVLSPLHEWGEARIFPFSGGTSLSFVHVPSVWQWDHL